MKYKVRHHFKSDNNSFLKAEAEIISEALFESLYKTDDDQAEKPFKNTLAV